MEAALTLPHDEIPCHLVELNGLPVPKGEYSLQGHILVLPAEPGDWVFVNNSTGFRLGIDGQWVRKN